MSTPFGDSAKSWARLGIFFRKLVKILAIETSTLTGSVALLENDSLIGEITLSVSAQHSESLLPAIDQLLSQARVKSAEIDLYAVAVGPGSFTGLRIGIAAAQGLSLAHQKPLVGVSTLRGLAMNAIFYSGIIVPVLNAFRGEVYFGLYRARDGIPFEIEADQVLPLEEFHRRMDSLKEDRLILDQGLGPRAAHIGFLAARDPTVSHGEALVFPRYLRRPG